MPVKLEEHITPYIYTNKTENMLQLSQYEA